MYMKRIIGMTDNLATTASHLPLKSCSKQPARSILQKNAIRAWKTQQNEVIEQQTISTLL
jgi:hypothetical protein